MTRKEGWVRRWVNLETLKICGSEAAIRAERARHVSREVGDGGERLQEGLHLHPLGGAAVQGDPQASAAMPGLVRLSGGAGGRHQGGGGLQETGRWEAGLEDKRRRRRGR